MASTGCVCGFRTLQSRWLQPRPSTSLTSRRPHAQRRATLQVAAAVDEKDKTGIDPEKVGVIPFIKDEETIQDVMAFTGTGSERINGRIAMMAFAFVSLYEVTGHRSVVQQLQDTPTKTILFMLLISIASLVPKYVSGVSLKDLYDAASREGLPDQLKFFNKTHEVWVGRVAMIGILGLTTVEIFKGGALFG